MASKQHELDEFSSKGKQLVMELKKIPDCDAQMMKKDMETLVDQWLDVSQTAEAASVLICFDYLLYFRLEWSKLCFTLAAQSIPVHSVNLWWF